MSRKFTDDELIAIRDEMIEFTDNKANKISQNELANSVGYSRAAISTFRNWERGKYIGNIDLIAGKIKNFIDEQKEHAAEKELLNLSDAGVHFVKTSIAQDVFQTLKYAHSYQKNCAIVGDPGCGKTIALRQYTIDQVSAFMVEATETTTSMSLLRSIYDALKLRGETKSNDMFEAIVAKLKDSKRLLIVDEGENLNTRCLEIIRRIQDFSHVGLVVCGTKKLESLLKGRKGELAQLSSRIGMRVELGMLKPSDTQMIIEANFPAAIELAPIFHQLCKSNARILQHLIDLVKMATSDGRQKITPKIIDDAADMLLTV